MFKYRGIRYRITQDGCYYIILFPDHIDYQTITGMSYPTVEEIKDYIDRVFEGRLYEENASNTNI